MATRLKTPTLRTVPKSKTECADLTHSITDEQIDAILDSPGSLDYVIADKRQRMHLFARRVLELRPADDTDLMPDDILDFARRMQDWHAGRMRYAKQIQADKGRHNFAFGRPQWHRKEGFRVDCVRSADFWAGYGGGYGLLRQAAFPLGGLHWRRRGRSMTRDEAIQKIKKCLALAASPNEHEAAAALRQAQKLMVQFGLTTEDMDLVDISEYAQKAQNASLVNWEACLASLVADAFGCHMFTSTQRDWAMAMLGRRRSTRSFVYVGVGAAAEVAGYAFDVLSRQCAKDRRAYMGKQSKNCKPKTKVARGDLYAEGWISGVRAKLDAFAGNAQHQERIARYMELNHPNNGPVMSKDRITGKNITGNDFHHGNKAGREAGLNHGLGACAPQAQIGRTLA